MSDDAATFDVDAFTTRMQTIADAFRQLGEVLVTAWKSLVAALTPMWRWLRSLHLDRYTPGAGRSYGPWPLAINGHDYHRRNRKRRQQ